MTATVVPRAAGTASRPLATELGTRGRRIAIWLDLLRVAGARDALRHLSASANRPDLPGRVRERVYRELWERAAASAGATVTELAPGVLELRRGRRRTRVFQQITELDDPVTLRLALDKPAVHRLVAAAGVPIPEYREFTLDDVEDPEPLLPTAPIVVKPAAGTGGGAGATCGIRTRDELRHAARRASLHGPRLLAEQQVEGTLHRLLVLDGRLLGAVARRPPRLTGDGQASVQRLVAAENRRRVAADGELGLPLLRLDLDCVLALRGQGLGFGSVPRRDRRFQVKVNTAENRPEDNETVTTGLAPEVIDAAARAARAVGLRLAGVDVITSDLGVPLERSGGAVVEVNGGPGLHHHHFVADPLRAPDVAEPILRTLLRIPEEGTTR